MSEHYQSRKFTDKSAAIANETPQKGKAAVEQSAQAIEQSYSVTLEKMRDYNRKMIDMAQANTAAVFDFARQLSTAKSSSDLVELWTANTRKQLGILNEQIKELSRLHRRQSQPAFLSLGGARAGVSLKPVQQFGCSFRFLVLCFEHAG
jgi:hypothetical protein